MRRESPQVSRMKTFWGSLLMFAVVGWVQAAPMYEENFTQVEGETVPDAIMVLDGQFAVKGTGPDRCLELPGSPLESFGVPADRSTLVNVHAIDGITRDFRGRQLVGVKGLSEKLEVSRSYTHLFKGM